MGQKSQLAFLCMVQVSIIVATQSLFAIDFARAEPKLSKPEQASSSVATANELFDGKYLITLDSLEQNRAERVEGHEINADREDGVARSWSRSGQHSRYRTARNAIANGKGKTRRVTETRSRHEEAGDGQDINKVEWWKKSSYYHIYVRSFRDSDGDGQGDLRGIIEKLDYLKMLGMDTVLMAPIYESSMRDGGYDITNHTAINPMFGTMQDFDDLLAGLKQRKMRIVMDFVPNHVSTDHHWFQCSDRALIEPERCGKYRDYFIWTNSTRFEGKYPTNWISVFGGGPAWSRSPVRNEFYLHQFLPQQADTNLSNPLVREEFKDIARFWLSKGIDGLRIDAMPFFLEDTTYWRDEPINKDWQEGDDPYMKLLHLYTFSYMGTPEIVQDWFRIAKHEFDGDRLIVNEAYAAFEDLIYAFGSTPQNRYTDLNFGFSMLGIEKEGIGPEMIVDKTMQWYNATREMNWPNERGTITPWLIWVLANHDNSRRVNVLGEKNFDIYQWIGFMMPGSPVVYYGDEIGTHNVHFDDIPERTKREGEVRRLPFRALMAWTPESPSAGFSNRSDNWMGLARNYKTHNVKVQLESADPHTHLKNFLEMQDLRTAHLETIIFGDLVIYANLLEDPVDHDDKTKRSMIYNLARVHDKYGSLMLSVNLSNSTCQKINLAQDGNKPSPPKQARVVLLNYLRNNEQDRLCGTLDSEKLHEGDEVSLDLLPLGPSQAAVFRFMIYLLGKNIEPSCYTEIVEEYAAKIQTRQTNGKAGSLES